MYNALPRSCEIKLVSVPEMRYHAKDNRGEVWCHGYNVFKGYLKDPAKTAEVLTPDGWLKTGDIGSIDAKGRLSIIDRKKNIFKLSQGEYVAPEKLENTFVKSGFVAQIYVHGDSLQVGGWG
jgi:long-chain acyl-CoA synthetase